MLQKIDLFCEIKITETQLAFFKMWHFSTPTLSGFEILDGVTVIIQNWPVSFFFAKLSEFH